MRVVLVLSILLLAGCLRGGDAPAPDPADVARDVEAAALPYLSQSHGDDSTDAAHYDHALHNASMNLERVGYHNGWDDTGSANAIPDGVYYTELDLRHGYVYLARGSLNPQPDGEAWGGFVIIDVNDPSNPRYMGEFNALLGSDIEVDADGRTAFFSTQRNTIEEMAATGGTSQDPTDSAPRGIHIVDVTDKTEPTAIGFYPFPYNGPHTIEYHQAGDREFLFTQTYDFWANTIPSPAGSPAGGALGALGVNPLTQRVTVLEIVRDPSGNDAGATLNPVAAFQVPATSQDELIFPHDVSVALHPMRGATYLYVSYWDRGVRIVDITDIPGGTPGQEDLPMLQEVGFFDQFDPSSRDNIHYAKPMDTLVDGRYILVTEPEIITAQETGYITFIDATTPSRPEKPCPTSWWTLPLEAGLHVDLLEFSPHNFDTFDGKVVLAHNHAGLWVIDASTPETLCEPKSVAFTLDVEPRIDSPRYQPYFWGAIEDNGLIYASDESSGLYVLRYTGP